jgi:regulator of RNase E activity RraA
VAARQEAILMTTLTTHPDALLDELRALNAPSISNAVELFDVRPRNEGFASGAIRCIFPHLPVMVGYAVTATIRAARRPPEDARDRLLAFYDHVLAVPGPRVVVIQDLDDPPAIGSFWGEVNANTFKAHGCIGVVTDGGVRDVDEVEPLGFHYFARDVIVSHAYVHVVESGIPVEIGGLTVRPGDLIHADKHGVMTVPHEIAALVPEAARRIEERERALINYCKSAEFTSAGLRELQRTLPPVMVPTGRVGETGSYA